MTLPRVIRSLEYGRLCAKGVTYIPWDRSGQRRNHPVRIAEHLQSRVSKQDADILLPAPAKPKNENGTRYFALQQNNAVEKPLF